MIAWGVFAYRNSYTDHRTAMMRKYRAVVANFSKARPGFEQTSFWLNISGGDISEKIKLDPDTSTELPQRAILEIARAERPDLELDRTTWSSLSKERIQEIRGALAAPLRFHATYRLPQPLIDSVDMTLPLSRVPPPVAMRLEVVGPHAQSYSIDLGQVRFREWTEGSGNQKTCRVQTHGIWEVC